MVFDKATPFHSTVDDVKLPVAKLAWGQLRGNRTNAFCVLLSNEAFASGNFNPDNEYACQRKL